MAQYNLSLPVNAAISSKANVSTSRPAIRLANVPFLLLLLLLLGLGLQPAQAQTLTLPDLTLPDIRYSTSSRTIYVGRVYDAANSAEAPYVGYPSHPNAPKISITIPQLAGALSAKGYTNLLLDQGNGVWLLKANLYINPNAKLEATNATIRELRLESIVVGSGKQYVKFIAYGGAILIQGITVRSWNTPANTVDTSSEIGRSHITIYNGGRMDILDSDVGYLGWRDPNPNAGDRGKGEPSGLAWKRRATADRPETGPTGQIVRSKIHDNYYGNYTWEAINMRFTDNEVYNHVYYGFDPHDYSANFVVARNKFYQNGGHGLIFSRGCVNNQIYENEFYDNVHHGFMLDRGSDNNRVYNNISHHNGEDGMAIFQSSNNIFTANEVYGNQRHGIRVNAAFDSGDRYEGLALDNVFQQNNVYSNTLYGFTLYERADRNSFITNTVKWNGSYGFYLRTGSNTLRGNRLSENQEEGLYVRGGSYDVGTIPAVGQAGRANSIASNIIQNNRANGIALYGGASESNISKNTIEKNAINGVLVQDSTTLRNRISRNRITNNASLGIRLSSGGNANMPAPTIQSVVNRVVSGRAAANARVEIYRDAGGEGAVYLGATTASSSGTWSFTLTDTGTTALTALAIDPLGNTSPFFATNLTAADTEEVHRIEASEAELLAQEAVESAEDFVSDDEESSEESLLNEFLNDVADVSIYDANQSMNQQTFLPVVINQ